MKASDLIQPLFLSPVEDRGRVFYLSDEAGQLSLWRLDLDSGRRRRLCEAALMHPDLLDGEALVVLPDGDPVLMLDQDGDERYQPCRVPAEGGSPTPIFGDRFAGASTHLQRVQGSRAVLGVEYYDREEVETWRVDLATGAAELLCRCRWGRAGIGLHGDEVWLLEAASPGDGLLWRHDGSLELVYGEPYEKQGRKPSTEFRTVVVVDGRRIALCALHDDHFGLVDLADLRPLRIRGLREGPGELHDLDLHQGRLRLVQNLGGVSFVHEARLEGDEVHVERVLVGEGELAGGWLQAMHGDWISWSSPTKPSRMLRLGEPPVLGAELPGLCPGEARPYRSHDGWTIDARLYRPTGPGPHPVVFYVHGGPQSQECADFTWFSMPLIQLLVAAGIAVWVPNARGSTGYGLRHMRAVERDWGGADLGDHLAALDRLREDGGLDLGRVGVVGRSYGGYMSLLLLNSGRFAAGVDMFGPADLVRFFDGIPAPWKPYFQRTVGDPVADRDFLLARSPIHSIGSKPMLVIQGRNDPRVVPAVSEEVADRARAAGARCELLIYEDEGHDVMKRSNKLHCYDSITDFFRRELLA